LRLNWYFLYLAAFRGLVTMLLIAAASEGMAACALRSAGGKIKQVIHIQFDNLHLRRDNPNVPSDLEQMPYLRAFLADNGVIAGNHHTSLLSDTATSALTILTGVYGDRMGMPVSDSYGFFQPDGSVGFASSFAYWTARAADGLPQMLAETGKMAPAPWVPFARAGCDVGIFSTANMALESMPSDIAAAFGKGSSELTAAAADPAKAKADFLGIAVHCARDSRFCADPTHARADPLPDEPGLYHGFSALFGNAHVRPLVSPNAAIRDLDGNIIQDAYGNPGFPNLFAPSASQSLGYAAAMLEAGIPIVYASIADAHEQISLQDGGRIPLGPGELAHMRQLSAYDRAFAHFVERLEAHGISKDNTLFVLTSDKGGHFVGGPPVPKTCDGTAVPCTYPNLGEIDVFADRLLATQRRNVTAFDIHFDNAPAFYIHGNPSSSDPLTRTLEQDVSKLAAINPVSGQAESLTVFLADRGALKLLHMITASPARTPSFAAFGAAGIFQMAAGSHADCGAPPACVEREPAYAWNHGGVYPDMSQSWFGLAGPGVRKLGLDYNVFSDHTDIRPTMLALLGLSDDYSHDGRVLAEMLETSALPSAMRDNLQTYLDLAAAYKALNAPLGVFGQDGLILATRAVQSSDQSYANFYATRDETTNTRDFLAGEMKRQLEETVFAGKPLDVNRAAYLISSARALIQNIAALAGDESQYGTVSAH
jgi:arylsulfatase A-like enzyme